MVAKIVKVTATRCALCPCPITRIIKPTTASAPAVPNAQQDAIGETKTPETAVKQEPISAQHPSV